MPLRHSDVLYSHIALVDTSAAIAILDPKESRHEMAKLYFECEPIKVWTALNLTAHESYTRTRYKTDYLKANQAFNFLHNTPLQTIDFLPEDETAALGLLEKFAEHALSFHDALCAAAMFRLGIYKIFTFDKDFLIMGFEIFPPLG